MLLPLAMGSKDLFWMFLWFRITPSRNHCPTSELLAPFWILVGRVHLPLISSVPHRYAMTQRWELCWPNTLILAFETGTNVMLPASLGHNRAREGVSAWGRARLPSMSQREGPLFRGGIATVPPPQGPLWTRMHWCSAPWSWCDRTPKKRPAHLWQAAPLSKAWIYRANAKASRIHSKASEQISDKPIKSPERQHLVVEL